MQQQRTLRIILFAFSIIAATFILSACLPGIPRYYETGSELTMTKMASPAQVTQAGEVITYKYVLTHNGQGTGPIRNISVTDSPLDGPVQCPQTTLNQGQSMTCTAQYTVTEADLAKGSITNNASAEGTFTTQYQEAVCLFFGQPPAQTITHTARASASFTVNTLPPLTDVTPAPGNPTLTLEKQAEPNVIHEFKNTLITYTFVLTNNGDVPLQGPFKIHDSLNPAQTTCEKDMLGVGETFSCSASFSLIFASKDTQSTIENCATAEGSYAGQIVTSNESCVNVTYIPPAEQPDEPEDNTLPTCTGMPPYPEGCMPPPG